MHPCPYLWHAPVLVRGGRGEEDGGRGRGYEDRARERERERENNILFVSIGSEGTGGLKKDLVGRLEPSSPGHCVTESKR